ncbi:hemin-degrading factor [Hahella sp. CCB-MM4]|uniref:hemin-degrading factor n=1 Tax=Hahella sp. (strain CCB-MM4) TaxID=1926491 RepID=UPI000B9BF6E2|nr:ChuX/HutX family heme-like substrate-binding protein [Hahella sp. CCB-MM4]OZG75376.1 hemin-degrading factor [Hahella sp. CCB-MM4]
MSTVLEQPANLKAAWSELRKEQPRLRIRNAARQLGVCELELLLTGLEHQITPLKADFGDMLIALQSVGRVMALTRNDQVVHERHGVYTDFKVSGNGAMGLCLGEIDLRTFFKHWRVAVAVKDKPKKNGDDSGCRHSIQFFDGEGEAIHKVYATDNTDMDAWQNWIEQFRAQNAPKFSPESKVPPTYPGAGQVTTEQLRTPWSSLKDVHHFNAMLNKLGIDRLEALTLVGDDYALKVPVHTVEEAISQAAEQQLSIMVFVGNGGIVQIHTGSVHRLLRKGPWFNVLDPDFNLHLNTEEIDSCWIVRRPTADGVVSSLECFNEDRELILTLFGERKPGQEELASWRSLLASLDVTGSERASC